jgi:hypothetical protein
MPIAGAGSLLDVSRHHLISSAIVAWKQIARRLDASTRLRQRVADLRRTVLRFVATCQAFERHDSEAIVHAPTTGAP